MKQTTHFILKKQLKNAEVEREYRTGLDTPRRCDLGLFLGELDGFLSKYHTTNSDDF